MIQPASLEELASLVEKDGKKVFLFVADWCGDCRYIRFYEHQGFKPQETIMEKVFKK